jgi:sigma-B regulation protein RsbU (phosphoserine phosphatase)
VRVEVAGGGHPPPILRRQGGAVEEVVVGGLFLGVLDDPPIATRRETLGPGDVLVLYTDGATESRRDGVMFEAGGVVDVVRGAPPTAHDVAGAIEAAVLDHSGGVISDDLALLVIRNTAPA